MSELEFSKTLDRLEDLDFVLTLRSFHEGKLSGYRGWISRVQWHTHPSYSASGVCEDCMDMRGLIFDVEDAEDLLPYHIHCYCELVPLEEEEE
jgi:hypothetical protein